MSDQPIIIEEESLMPQMPKAENNSNQEQFFQLLDSVQDYDAISMKIKQKYRDAMIGLASIKFSQPHALNVNAHKCFPAFLKATNKGALVYQYSPFVNPALEDEVYPDQYEEQEQIENLCLEKQKQLQKIENNSQKRQHIENQLLKRFNVANQQQKVLSISHQFKEVIQLLLQLQQNRDSFLKNIEKMEKNQ